MSTNDWQTQSSPAKPVTWLGQWVARQWHGLSWCSRGQKLLGHFGFLQHRPPQHRPLAKGCHVTHNKTQKLRHMGPFPNSVIKALSLITFNPCCGHQTCEQSRPGSIPGLASKPGLLPNDLLACGAKNYKFCMFCQQWHPSAEQDEADIRRTNTSWIHSYQLLISQFCLCIPLEIQVDTSFNQNIYNIVLSCHANLRKIYQRMPQHGLKSKG